MNNLRLNDVLVHAGELTQASYRAASCRFLLPVTRGNRAKMLSHFARVGAFGPYSGLRVSGLADLSFLQDFPDLLYLEVLEQKNVDVEQLHCLANLRGLRIETPGTGLDFASFPALEVFVGDWHADNRNLAQCRELRTLRAWQFKPRSMDLAELVGLTRLETLGLIKTTLESLTGIERLEDLRYFDLTYAPQLQTLDAFSAGGSQLRELSIANAKKIASYLPLASCHWLRRLKLSSCTPMPDLQWTKGMNQLDLFTFVETIVESGDLTPLLDLPKLRDVGTMDKKHYNLKSIALNELLKQRHALQGTQP